MPTVKTKCADTICVISLNRPENLNAITLELLDELNAAFVDAHTADHVHCIVFHGEGRSFCAGDDLKEQGEISARGIAAVAAQTAAIQQVTHGIMFGPKPVIGAIEGWAVGAGLSWTLNCDLTVWAEGAKGFFPEIGYGTFVSGGATHLLPSCVGPMRASEIMLSGRKIAAAELHGLGWATHLAPTGKAYNEAMRLAAEIAAKPENAVHWTKRALREPEKGLLLSAMTNESAACLDAFRPETLARMQDGLKRGNAQ